ncbi:MAG: hypothetical protein AAF514_06345 [Verrucomicrobiota bacterium]
MKPYPIPLLSGLAGLLCGLGFSLRPPPHVDSIRTADPPPGTAPSLIGNNPTRTHPADQSLYQTFLSFADAVETVERPQQWDYLWRNLDRFPSLFQRTLRPWFLREWGARHPETARKVIGLKAGMAPGGYPNRLLKSVYEGWARLNPEEAMKAAAQEILPPNRNEAQNAVLALIADDDPAQAFALAQKKGVKRPGIIISTWMRKEPREALRELARLAESDSDWHRHMNDHTLAQSWPTDQLESDLRWLAEVALPGGFSRKGLQFRLLERLSRTDRETAFDLAADQGVPFLFRQNTFVEWVKDDPETATGWINRLPPATPERNQALLGWSRSGMTDEATIRTQADSLPDQTRSKFLRNTLSHYPSPDMAQQISWLQTWKDDLYDDTIDLHLAYLAEKSGIPGENAMEKALRAAAGLPAHERRDLEQGFFKNNTLPDTQKLAWLQDHASSPEVATALRSATNRKALVDNMILEWKDLSLEGLRPLVQALTDLGEDVSPLRTRVKEEVWKELAPAGLPEEGRKEP